MNDPGLDEPISNDAKAVEENRQKDEHDEAREDEQQFLDPSRWWFASTAFPLVAGTFGPMASAFSICALVVHWRAYVPPGTLEDDGVDLPDPNWLIGINAAQLVIAIISNLSLLLNMARRLRFSIAQPITIIGWYISSFALVALTATAKGPLAAYDAPKDHVYTQALYYAIFSAGLYFIVASLMVVTVYGAYRGHYDKEFKLTMSQRTLMLQTISFMVYLLLGATVYTHVEGWDFLDAVYWADFTLLTVGIGDFSPVTHTGRALLFPFAIGGIIILGLVIGSIRSLVLERGKVKLGARMVEKERERILKMLERKHKDDILNPIDGDQSNMSRASSHTLEDRERSEMSERARREEEFNLMRKIQEQAATKRRWTSLCISATTWFFLWFAGAAVFQASEVSQGWTYFEALYFAYTSLLTIGYGDIFPMSNSGKPFFVFWSLLAVPSLTVLISNMGDTIVKFIRDFTLWLGEVTVLPGDKGIRDGIKLKIHHATGRRVFSDIQEQPPGILGDSNRNPEDEEGDASHPKNDPDGAGQRAAGERAEQDQAKAKKRGESNDKKARPESRRHYHSMLIEEIGSVMKHLNSQPPRKYTFDEWAWYLALIGEDESSAETHRRAIKKPKMDGEGVGTATEGDLDDGKGFNGQAGAEGLGGKGEAAVAQEQTREKDNGMTGETTKWSWVGNRSPLMGNKEEAEWVLERLTRTLQRELDAMRKEELEGKGDWEDGGPMNQHFKKGGSAAERKEEKMKDSEEQEVKEEPRAESSGTEVSKGNEK